jgi:hypothetical protein
VDADRRDDGLRLVTNPAFVSTELRPGEVARGGLIAEVTALLR